MVGQGKDREYQRACVAEAIHNNVSRKTAKRSRFGASVHVPRHYLSWGGSVGLCDMNGLRAVRVMHSVLPVLDRKQRKATRQALNLLTPCAHPFHQFMCHAGSGKTRIALRVIQDAMRKLAALGTPNQAPDETAHTSSDKPQRQQLQAASEGENAAPGPSNASLEDLETGETPKRRLAAVFLAPTVALCMQVRPYFRHLSEQISLLGFARC
eukprot:1162113-Pelagomonas_calceolata.AAC.18